VHRNPVSDASLEGAGGVSQDDGIFFRPLDAIEEEKNPRWPELNYYPAQRSTQEISRISGINNIYKKIAAHHQ